MGRFLRIACAGTAVMSLALGHAAFATGDQEGPTEYEVARLAQLA